VIKNLKVTAVSGPTVNTNVFTLYKNGVSTSLTATLATNGTSASDTTHIVNCKPGDTLNVRMTGSGTTAKNISVTVEMY
jgi:hypothetical protein